MRTITNFPNFNEKYAKLLKHLQKPLFLKELMTKTTLFSAMHNCLFFEAKFMV